MSNTELQRIINHIREHAPRYYPEFMQAQVQVQLIRADRRRASSLYRFDLNSPQFTRPVLVKKPPVGGEPVRVRRQTDPEIKFRSEYEALVAIHSHFERLNDPRLAAIRPLDFIADQLAIVMERIPHPSLRQLLLKASRLQPQSSRAQLNRAFRNAGIWLRHFHGLTRHQHVEIRPAQRDEFIEAINHLAHALAKALGDKRFFCALAQKVGADALAALPPSLPVGMQHGDFALRNLLIGPESRVTGIDTQARKPSPVYEDISYFLISLTTTWPQILSQGLVFDSLQLGHYENEFLSGYFEGEAIPDECIRLFKIKMMLDKWHARVFYLNQPRKRWRFGSNRVSKVLTHRFFRMHSKRLLHAGRRSE